MYLVVGILFKLINNVMFSETGKQFWKEFGIVHGGQVTQINILVSYTPVYNWSASRRNYSTSKELEQGKLFIKQILIGKADKVCSEQLMWNPRAYKHMYQTSTTIFAVKHQNVFVHFQDETNNNQWSITWSYDSKWMITQTFLFRLSLMHLAWENSTKNCFHEMMKLL